MSLTLWTRMKYQMLCQMSLTFLKSPDDMPFCVWVPWPMSSSKQHAQAFKTGMSLLVTGRPTRCSTWETSEVATLEKHTMYSVPCAPTEEPKPGAPGDVVRRTMVCAEGWSKLVLWSEELKLFSSKMPSKMLTSKVELSIFGYFWTMNTIFSLGRYFYHFFPLGS